MVSVYLLVTRCVDMFWRIRPTYRDIYKMTRNKTWSLRDTIFDTPYSLDNLLADNHAPYIQ